MNLLSLRITSVGRLAIALAYKLVCGWSSFVSKGGGYRVSCYASGYRAQTQGSGSGSSSSSSSSTTTKSSRLLFSFGRVSSTACFSKLAAASTTMTETAENTTASCGTEEKATVEAASGTLTIEGIQPAPNGIAMKDIETFPQEILFYDHYNGVTIHLENCNDQHKEDLLNPVSFELRLSAALEQWKREGKKGIWIHCPVEHASIVPIATALKFDFHMVHNRKVLVLSQWLPEDVTSKLPLGPTHQVGVGCFILAPWDYSQMLVVQEKTGPAAAFGLWKMPTGLSDPGEDVHVAAERELWEETGLKADFEGILIFRQAHSTRSGTRASSDMFFVCQMQLQLPEGVTEENHEGLFQACPDEIAAIRWMSVEDYCNQDRWQTSPVYQEMNRVILRASRLQQQQRSASNKELSYLVDKETLTLGFGTQNTLTNTLYYQKSSL